MHEGLVGALRDWDPRPLRNWLSQRGVDTEELWELPRWNADRSPNGLPCARRAPDRLPRVTAAVSAAVPKVADAPGGVALLLLHLLRDVDEAFQVSYHFRPLWDTLRGARACVHNHGMPSRNADALAVRSVLALMVCQDRGIFAENEMTTGRLAAYADAALSAALWAREAVDLADLVSSEYPELGSHLAELAAEFDIYNSAIAVGVRGLVDFFESGVPLDNVIADLLRAETDPRVHSSVSRSELRALRFSLISLNRELTSEWLRVDHGRLVYLYPFAIRGIPSESVLERARTAAAGWSLAGVSPAAVHQSLELDDVWDGSDSLGRRYDGALIEMPTVVLRGQDGVEMGRAGTQIRFSRLGNHYVRFEAELRDVAPADLYAMMFRAAPEHGAVRVAFEGTVQEGESRTAEDWPRLSHLAVQLVEDIGGRLLEHAEMSGAREVTRPRMFQVVVTVNAASTGPGPARTAARRDVLTLGELTAAAGVQVLTNPVTYLVGAAAEWSRYAKDSGMSSVTTGLAEDWMVRTPNTTVVVMLGAADFSNGTRASLAEFAASLDGLLAGWSDELAGHYSRAKDFQTRVAAMEDSGILTAKELHVLSQELDKEKFALSDFAVETRSVVALIQSPSLLASPVAAESLRTFLDSSGFQRRVDELRAKIDEVANDQLGVTIEKLASQRLEQQRMKVEVFLAVIAVAGVSGVIQVLQTGFSQGEVWVQWAVGGVAAIVAGAIALGWWVGNGGWRRR